MMVVYTPSSPLLLALVGVVCLFHAAGAQIPAGLICPTCRAFAQPFDANGNTPSLVDDCYDNLKYQLGPSVPNTCIPFKDQHLNTIQTRKDKISKNPGYHYLQLCAINEFCGHVQSFVQHHLPESEMNKIGANREMRIQCSRCKSMTHAVRVTLQELENIPDLGDSSAVRLCLEHWAVLNKPFWHQLCRCKTLVYDILYSPERISGATNERVCESLGFCDVHEVAITPPKFNYDLSFLQSK